MARGYRTLLRLGATSCAIAVATAAGAAPWTLQDLTSTVVVEPVRNGTNPVGVIDWRVGGLQGNRDHMYEQAFWFRLEGDTQETSLHTLPISFQNASDTNANPGNDVLNIVYTGPGFTAEVKYTLVGSAAGCCSDLGEQVKITNTGSSTIAFTLIEYVDFDLNGDGIFKNADEWASAELGVIGDFFEQRDGSILSRTSVLPDPDHWEISLYSTLKNSLDDNALTTLLDATSPLGPGDMVWAAQWDWDIEPGRSVIVSKDKLINVVPLPASILFLAPALGGLALFGRRRKAAAV